MSWYTLLGIHPTVYLNVYQFSLDLAGCPRTITDTKKPAGPALCGLLGLYWMTLVITNREIWAGRSLTRVRNSYILPIVIRKQ